MDALYGEAGGEYFRLHTGREVYADGHLLSVTIDGRGVRHGDGGSVPDTTLTLAERLEIAVYMVERWMAWAQHAPTEADVMTVAVHPQARRP
jgi:hypothetical protein